MPQPIYFVHIPKTAGTAVRAHLAAYTEIHGAESWRYHEFGVRTSPRLPVEEGGHSTWKTPFWPCYLDQPTFHASISFTVVRNPFSMLYSYWSHRSKDYYGAIDNGYGNCNVAHRIESFADFVHKYCDADFAWHVPLMKNHLYSPIFDCEGKSRIHFAVRYERLEEGVAELAHALGIALPKRIPVKNTGRRVDYRGYYTDEMRRLVRHKCALELETFGYTFDSFGNDALLDARGMFVSPRLLVAD